MTMDMFLNYLIDSASSMPIHLDEDMFTQLEDSWRWRHLEPGFFDDEQHNDQLILKWTRDTLAEADILGVEDVEFNQNLAVALQSETFLASLRAFHLECSYQDLQDLTPFGLEYVLLSGKLGDAEDFLDTNILPLLGDVRLLYDDWSASPESRPSVRNPMAIRTFFNSNKDSVLPSTSIPFANSPLSNVTNIFQSSQRKRYMTPSDGSPLLKKRKHNSIASLPAQRLSKTKHCFGAKRSMTTVLGNIGEIAELVDGEADNDQQAIGTSPVSLSEDEIQALVEMIEEPTRLGRDHSYSYAEDFEDVDIIVNCEPSIPNFFARAPDISVPRSDMEEMSHCISAVDYPFYDFTEFNDEPYSFEIFPSSSSMRPVGDVAQRVDEYEDGIIADSESRIGSSDENTLSPKNTFASTLIAQEHHITLSSAISLLSTRPSSSSMSSSSMESTPSLSRCSSSSSVRSISSPSPASFFSNSSGDGVAASFSSGHSEVVGKALQRPSIDVQKMFARFADQQELDHPFSTLLD